MEKKMNSIYEKLTTCLASVREKTDFVPETAIVLGSGLGMAVAIWSEISKKSPGLKSVLRPPAAFVSISFFAVIGATITDNFGVKMPEGTIGHSILEEL